MPAPPDWARNIVTAKVCDTESEAGRGIFEQVRSRLRGRRLGLREAADGTPMFGDSVLMRPRLGQSGFRVLVTENCEPHRAVTGDKILPVLEVAHIRPVTEGGTHRVDNGCCCAATYIGSSIAATSRSARGSTWSG